MSSLRAAARRFANRDAWADGVACFEREVEARPDDAEALAHLAFFVVKESRYDTERGLQLLERALALDPRCAVAWVYRGMILGTMLAEDEAREALARAEQVGALEQDLVRTRAWIALDMWKLDEALAGFGRLVEVCAESSSCVLLATAFLQAGDHLAALAAALQAVEREPDDFRGFTYAGVACANMGRFDEARGHLERAAALQPRSPLVHHTLGWAALQQGDIAAAERHLREAVRVDPLYVTSRRLLGDLCAASGRAGEAREHYLAALDVFPGYAEVRDALAALGDVPS